MEQQNEIIITLRIKTYYEWLFQPPVVLKFIPVFI